MRYIDDTEKTDGIENRLREMLDALKNRQTNGAGSRGLSLAITKLEECLFWIGQ